MTVVATYSFKSVHLSISGPGGNIALGNTAGAAQEGISVEMAEEKDLATVGADGTIMHSLRASDLGRMTVRLLKVSPANAALNQMYNFQKANSGRWGQNTLTLTDTYRGDVITITGASFTRQANIAYAQDGNTNEWIFVGKRSDLLGTGSSIAA